MQHEKTVFQLEGKKEKVWMDFEYSGLPLYLWKKIM